MRRIFIESRPPLFSGSGPAYVVSFAVAAGWLVLAAALVSRIKLS
jgi:hypothetical protein